MFYTLKHADGSVSFMDESMVSVLRCEDENGNILKGIAAFHELEKREKRYAEYNKWLKEHGVKAWRVVWDVEYIPNNCDNINIFRNESEAKEFAKLRSMCGYVAEVDEILLDPNDDCFDDGF